MEGGGGAYSYARNSQLQAGYFALSKPFLLNAIARVDFSTSSLITVADFGCSCGYNTISAVNFVFDAIRQGFIGSQDVEFQALFTDQARNDFNTLLSMVAQKGDSFSAAAAGSFYKRLFPRSSINVAMCNSALHWLSKVPDNVDNPNNVYIPDKSVHFKAYKAYQQQSMDDLCNFLQSRSHELVDEGILSIVTGGAHEGCIQCFQLAWEELVQEGLISQHTMDTFNVPVFFPSAEEIHKAVETTSCFEVVFLETLNAPFPDYPSAKATAEAQGKNLSVKSYAAAAFKATANSLVLEHLKDAQLASLLFSKMETNMVTKLLSHDGDSYQAEVVVAILSRKPKQN